MRIQVTPALEIDDEEIEERFVRASGAGGQNVNKVATAVQLRFDPSRLPADVRARLSKLVRLTDEGIVLIEASRFRTQARNRADALERLLETIRKASIRPRARRPTRPTAASRRNRVETKIHRSQVKRRRGPVRDEE